MVYTLEMMQFQRFQDEGYKNWIKSTMGLVYFRDYLEKFLEDETETYHQKLRDKVNLQEEECTKSCSFNNWDPRSSKIPRLDCEVCDRWRDEILANHTSKDGKVLWRNSKPHLWSTNKWEVAKVYMPNGHAKHSSAGDFDLPAFLSLMTQCRHFSKYVQQKPCTEVSNVRNNVMHSPNLKVTQDDLREYLRRIKSLANTLEEHSKLFNGLTQELDKLQNLDFSLMLNGSTEAEKFLDKELQIMKEKMEYLTQKVEEATENMLTPNELHDMEKFLAENKDLQVKLDSQWQSLKEIQEQQGQQLQQLNTRVEKLEKRACEPDDSIPWYKNHLFEVAKKLKWSEPSFSETREGLGFRGQVKINDRIFTGEKVHRSKVQAHQEAAKIALEDSAIAAAIDKVNGVDSASVAQAGLSFFCSVTVELDIKVFPDQIGSETEEAMESAYKKLVPLFGLDPSASDSKDAVLLYCQTYKVSPPEENSGPKGFLRLRGSITFHDPEGSSTKKQTQQQAAKAALQGLHGILQEINVFSENYIGALKEALEASNLGQPSYDFSQTPKQGVTWVGKQSPAEQGGRRVEAEEASQRNEEETEQGQRDERAHAANELPVTYQGTGDAGGSNQSNYLLPAATLTQVTPAKTRERNISGDNRQFLGYVAVTIQKDLGPSEASSQEGAVQEAYSKLLTDLSLGPAATAAGEKQSVVEFFTQKESPLPLEDIVKTSDGMFRCTLTVKGPLTFCSPVGTSRKQEAEQLAAKEALKHLEGLLSTAGENYKGRLQELLAKHQTGSKPEYSTKVIVTGPWEQIG
ncbi:uncharacterized protein LOC115375706 isoform X2 [Myripristis murdjan]|uniref:uncharacterized protein LOC115375706 isoform X2 n=1 Tax=Myripristis murdjan TaxID=586833 RepID=UPI001175EDDC|nr:uncharacterized protein LOC115375706 isoform X2 [Myripristis murdjan]